VYAPNSYNWTVYTSPPYGGSSFTAGTLYAILPKDLMPELPFSAPKLR